MLARGASYRAGGTPFRKRAGLEGPARGRTWVTRAWGLAAAFVLSSGHGFIIGPSGAEARAARLGCTGDR